MSKKGKTYIAGNCNYCNKELYSNVGGWIVCADRNPTTRMNMLFCHDGTDKGCWGKYGKLCKEIAHQVTWEFNLRKFWKNHPPYNQYEKKNGTDNRD